MNLKCLPLQERPRERLARYGPSGVATIELIAILLGSGTQSRSVLELSADLLGHFGSLQALADASLQELKEVKGIGEAKAILLQAAFGLLGRIEPKEQGLYLNTPEKVYSLIRHELSESKTEQLLVLARDARKCHITREIVSKGTLAEVLMHPREIFHFAIRHRAHSLIIAHNHPSGDPTPSPRDLEMTQLLATVGRVVGIELSDHLIIGRSGFVSLFNHGLLARDQY